MWKIKRFCDRHILVKHKVKNKIKFRSRLLLRRGGREGHGRSFDNVVPTLK